MKHIQDLGEFGIIEGLRGRFRALRNLVIAGIGDDCAVMEGREGFFYLLTCDTQVEGVHFFPDTPPRLLGKRVLAVNLSDIAAMGGVPLLALLSFVLRPSLPVDFWEEFIAGLEEEAGAYGVDIVGGNLARTEGVLSFDVTLLGEVEKERPLLLRSNARVGDAVLVTGYLGESRAGLLIAQEGSESEKERYRPLWERFLLPEPRIAVGRFLGALGERVALIDISDGLTQDLSHIAEESGVGMVLEAGAIPISARLRDWCEEKGEEPLQLALEGGEDFELLFTVPKKCAEDVARDIEESCGVKTWVVGEVVEKRGIYLKKEGKIESVVLRGWNHFQR
ncbi:MAG: thiamine-phosphate kinase [Candidatus Caldatribacteriaceae bacterium]